MPGLLRLPLVTLSREKTTRRSRLPGQANRLDDPGRNAGRHGMVGHRSGNNSFRRDARAIADIDVEDHGKGIDPDIATDHLPLGFTDRHAPLDVTTRADAGLVMRPARVGVYEDRTRAFRPGASSAVSTNSDGGGRTAFWKCSSSTGIFAINVENKRGAQSR